MFSLLYEYLDGAVLEEAGPEEEHRPTDVGGDVQPREVLRHPRLPFGEPRRCILSIFDPVADEDSRGKEGDDPGAKGGDEDEGRDEAWKVKGRHEIYNAIVDLRGSRKSLKERRGGGGK